MRTQRHRGCAVVVAAVLMMLAGASVTLAQQFSTLVNFGVANGALPLAGLTQGVDGNFYGTTYYGGTSINCGTSGCGAVFKVTPKGALTVLYSFCAETGCTDGYEPNTSLLQASDGTFYGTVPFGGPHSFGTVFKITTTGTLTTLYGFCSQTNCTDGENPYVGLVQGTDGNFYGTTFYGGANFGGTIFKITPTGTLTTLYSFCAQAHCTDGEYPRAGLVQASDGNFYGTTEGGGTSQACYQIGCGTVFKITPTGTLTTLHSFDSADGFYPFGALIQATDGNFYGTTDGGGTGVYNGTVFKMTPTGKLTTLYSFCAQTSCADGANPQAGLVQATDGNFYGTTLSGGVPTGSCSNFGQLGCGTVFEITPKGALTTLYSFGEPSGAQPEAGLVQATSGALYGTTSQGGNNNSCSFFNEEEGCGTVFTLSVGLGPFVKTLPTSGRVGAVVKILGSHLTNATGVTFNQTAATFTVVSASEITTTVPAGASSGRVQVTLPGQTLSSNVPFRVIP